MLLSLRKYQNKTVNNSARHPVFSMSEKYIFLRMTLLITVFLVLVNIFNSITTNIPKAEGLTAIEAWVIVCVLFVFGALVGNILILFPLGGGQKYHKAEWCNKVCLQEVSSSRGRDEKHIVAGIDYKWEVGTITFLGLSFFLGSSSYLGCT